MNLVVDYGNTAAKVGIFDHHALMQKHTFMQAEVLLEFLHESKAENVLVSSVTAEASDVMSAIRHAKRKFVLHHTLPLPIHNLYATPATLGADRLAGACGARHLFPDFASLVIDAGTCINYDFIDKAGNYYGGGISPGLSMRFKALHTFTAKLPLITAKQTTPLIGDSTETSIRSGVVNGMIAEIEGFIQAYKEKSGDVKVILCGGDAPFFENQLKASIFASPELVLIGLNSILNHNVSL
jgi:type III pantothenate kinase